MYFALVLGINHDQQLSQIWRPTELIVHHIIIFFIESHVLLILVFKFD